MRLIILAVILLPLLSRAQTGLELLQASVEKIKKLETIRYTVYATNYQGQASADVSIKRGGDWPIFETARIKASGISMEAEGSIQVNFSYDGRTFDFLDNKSNQLVSLDSPSYNKLGRVGLIKYTGLALSPYWQKEPFDQILKNNPTAERMIDTVIFNAPCYKIKLHWEINHEILGKRSVGSTWYFDKTSMLVCGLVTSTEQYFLKIISVNSSFEEGYFRLTRQNNIKKIDGLETLKDGLLVPGTKAPGWKLSSSLNKGISLDGMKGNIVLLDFWGTWCVPCLKAMPDIQAIHEHFKTEKVKVIGVSVETEKAADPVAYVKRKGYTYPIVLGGDQITKPYKVVYFPTIYIIDKHGKIIHAEHSGNRENFKEDIINRINAALIEK